MRRREFIAGTLATVGSALAARRGHAAEKTAPLGVQLFTFNALASSGWEGFAAALQTAHDIGFRSVELPGLMGQRPAQVKARAQELDLQLRSFHMGNDQVRERRKSGQSIPDIQNEVYTPDGVLDVARINLPLAKELGCQWGVIGAAGRSNFESRTSILKLCEAFNEANRLARRLGLHLSYHMHAPDFEPVDGIVPFDLMLANTDSSIRYQLDVCWAAAAGRDPAALIQAHHARLVSLHLKDLAADKAHSATPGDGILDFDAIRRVVHLMQDPLLYVERDNAPGDDPVPQARRAFEFLRAHGW